jgi:hypothetical protein
MSSDDPTPPPPAGSDPPPPEPIAERPRAERPPAEVPPTEVTPPPITEPPTEVPPPPVVAEPSAADQRPVVAESPVVAEPAPSSRRSYTSLKVLSWLVIAAGIILIVAGTVTWFVVRNELSDEKITVSEDADHFAGDKVEGPFTAYSQADTINKHALEASGGKTYAELDQDDPVRQTVMTASFLRASLFTSVVSFGVAAFAAGVGVLMLIIGFVLLKVTAALASLRSQPAAVT